MADDAGERLRLAHALLDAMHFDERLDPRRRPAPAGASEAELLEHEAVQSEIYKRIGPHLRRPTIAAAYARLLDAAELREIVAFYESPTGQKLLAVKVEVDRADGERMRELHEPTSRPTAILPLSARRT